MTDTFTFPATRERSDARRAFLADVLTTAIEGGVQYWADVLVYRWSDPSLKHGNGTRDAYAELVESDYEEEETQDLLRVTLDTIARGWRLYEGQTLSGSEYGRQAMLADRTNGDDGDYDADVADNVLQLGLFGEVRYG